MRKYLKRSLALLLSAVMLICAVPVQGFAAEDSGSEFTGTYSYTSNEGSNKQETDRFIWRDDFFKTYASHNNPGLCTLSTQVALASASRYGDAEDSYESDPDNNGKNILDMLTQMGFQDVSANQWYSKEKLENTCGVAVGHKTIEAKGKTYTLIAVIPRSAGYKQEWAGNFTVGTGDIHAGFKAARDEVLRYLKQYMDQHQISGYLKIWIAGHSRGAAISNLLGAFFVGGGIPYFGSQVSVTPDDVYCYTFATPRVVKDGVSKKDLLSVEGYRGDADPAYQYDSPGEAYISTEEGSFEVSDLDFLGIRNYPFSYDFITHLPPSAWGFTYFGQILEFYNAIEPNMRNELQTVSRFAFDKYVEFGEPYEFREKTLDPETLEIIDVKDGAWGQDVMTAFCAARIDGLRHMFPTNKDYVASGGEETLKGVAGIYGMMQDFAGVAKGRVYELIQPAVLAYLSYAAEQLVAEGRAADEDEGAVIAIKELVEYMTGKPIDLSTYTVDEFIATVAEFIVVRKHTEAVCDSLAKITQTVPYEYETIARGLIGKFHQGTPSEIAKASLYVLIMDMLEACVYGAKEGSLAYIEDEGRYRDPKEARKYLYSLIFAMSMLGGRSEDVGNAIGKDSNGTLDGSGSFSDFAKVILQILKGYKEGDVQKTYATLADAADAGLTEKYVSITGEMLRAMENTELFDSSYQEMARGHVNTVSGNIPTVRKAVMNILFYHGEGVPYDTEKNIRSVCTLIGNIKKVPPAHYNEVFVAWAKAEWRAAPGAVIPVGRITITGSHTVGVGKKTAHEVSIMPKDADFKKLEWSSSDEKIAKVDPETGVVTGVSPGSVTITLKLTDEDEISETFDMTVTAPVCRVAVMNGEENVTKKTIPVDRITRNTMSLSANCFDKNGNKLTEEKVKWTSNKPEIAPVDENGEVTLLGTGTVKITAASMDGTDKSATVILKIGQTKVTIRGPREIAAGKSAKLVAMGPKVTWSIDSVTDPKGAAVTLDKNDVRISKAGVLSVSKKVPLGTVIKVVSKAGTEKDEHEVTVTRSDPKAAVKLYLGTADITKGTIGIDRQQMEAIQLNARVADGSGSMDQISQAVIWKSSNTKVAIVDEDGWVIPVSAGKTWITATTADGTKKAAKVKVNIAYLVRKVTVSGADQIKGGAKATAKYTVTVGPYNAANKKVTWSIDSVTDQKGSAVTLKKNDVRISNGKLTISKNVQVGSVIKIRAATQDGSRLTAYYEVEVK